MRYELYIIPSARKQFKKLPDNTKKAIRKKLDNLCVDPFAQGFDVKKMKGQDAYRLRVGTYRVIYELHNNTLVLKVLTVGHRKDVYQ